MMEHDIENLECESYDGVCTCHELYARWFKQGQYMRKVGNDILRTSELWNYAMCKLARKAYKDGYKTK